MNRLRATRRLLPLALALVAVAPACHRGPDAYNITTPERADRIMAISASTASAPADGMTQVTISVKLDPLTKADERSVTFSTSAGSFLPAGTGAKIVVQADQLGGAQAVLQAPDGPTIATVVAAVKDFSRQIDITFRQPNPDDVFTLSVDATSIPADGTSRARITATLKFAGGPAQRSARFTASAGTLIAPGASGSTVTVQADSNGNAAAFLQSPATPGTAQVLVTVATVTRSVDITFAAR